MADMRYHDSRDPRQSDKVWYLYKNNIVQIHSVAKTIIVTQWILIFEMDIF